MIFNITPERIQQYLIQAKDKHTAAYGNDPNHDWVPFYADVIYANLLVEMAEAVKYEMAYVNLKQNYANQQKSNEDNFLQDDYSWQNDSAEQMQDRVGQMVDNAKKIDWSTIEPITSLDT